MTRWMWLALALTLGGVQLGCDSNVDSDGDGVLDSEDCDVHSPLKWKQARAYVDDDGDGYGSGALVRLCTGSLLPQGYVSQGDDCAPFDATRWRTPEGLYYVDADGDGVGLGPRVTACVGAGPELTGYTRTKDEDDCNDRDPSVWASRSLYTDEDKDGVPGGVPLQRCIGATLPPGTFEMGTDCAPSDASRYALAHYFHRDADGDGATVPEEGTLCSGPLLPEGYYFGPASQEDCDDSRAERWVMLGVYRDTDGDGVGGGPAEPRCSAPYLEEPGFSHTPGDCAPEDRTRWELQNYAWRDADGDGALAAASGQVCSGTSLPGGYSTWPSTPLDCDDTDATVRVTWNLFPDTDNDGVGAGSRVTLCAGPTRPAGYSDKDTDCAPDEPSRWQGLTYQYRDADGDSFTVAAGGSLCAGASLPAGYSNTPRGEDCDDSRADVHQGFQAYADEDGDGVGAGTAAPFCTDGSVPEGYSRQGTDCAPDDALLWRLLAYQHVDADGDGRTVPATGQVCAGPALPPPYATTASGNDCDDANPALSLWRVLYPDQDGDGVGAPPRTVRCLDDGPVPTGLSPYGFDPDDSDPGVTDAAESPELEVLLLGK